MCAIVIRQIKLRSYPKISSYVLVSVILKVEVSIPVEIQVNVSAPIVLKNCCFSTFRTTSGCCSTYRTTSGFFTTQSNVPLMLYKNKIFRSRHVVFINLNFLYFLFTNICACTFWDRLLMSEIVNSHVANKCPLITYAYAIYQIRRDLQIPLIGIRKLILISK